jgi:hypothetical protein
VPVLALAGSGCGGSGIVPDARGASGGAGEPASNHVSVSAPVTPGTSRVIVIRPPDLPSEPLQLDMGAMREAEKRSQNRTLDPYHGASHEATKAIEAARSEERNEGVRSPADEVSNTAEEVRGALMVRDEGHVAGLSNAASSVSESQRAAQKAMEGRYRAPTRPSN